MVNLSRMFLSLTEYDIYIIYIYIYIYIYMYILYYLISPTINTKKGEKAEKSKTSKTWCFLLRDLYGLKLRNHRGIFCELFTFTTSICRLFFGVE